MGLGAVVPVLCGEQFCEPSHSFGPARREYYLLHFDFHGKQKRRKQEGTMAKNDYTQKQTNKNNSENTQKNQSKNSTKESTSDCKDKNNQ